MLARGLDVNPNNILVDGADTPSTIVKLSDLGGCKNVFNSENELKDC